MWKKLVVVWTIIMILSFTVSMKVDRILIAGEDDAMEWNKYERAELTS